VLIYRRLFLSLLVLVMTSGVTTAQVYRSVDESGNVIFSDSPPPEAVESSPVEIQPGPTAAQVQDAQERAEIERQQFEARRAAREAEATKQREERARRAAIVADVAARPQPGSYDDPDARAWWRHRGVRPPPSDQPSEESRAPTGDHPDFWPGQ